MKQYRDVYKHIEEVIKNLGQLKLFCYFFSWDWNAKLATNSHLHMLPLLCHTSQGFTESCFV